MMTVNDFICHIITIIIMQIIFIYNYGNMTEQKVKINIKYYLVIFVTSLMLFINNFYNIMCFRIFIGLLINILTSSLIYNERIHISLFYSFVHTIIVMILEMLLTPILALKFDNLELLNNSTIFKSLFSIFAAIITIFIFKNSIINNYIKKLKAILLNKTNLKIVAIITLFVLNFIGFARAIKTSDILLIIITFICVSFMLMTIKIIINDKYNMRILNIQTNNIKDSIKAYSKTIDDCRELKHNLKNDLLTLKSGLNKDSQYKINEIITKYNNNYEWINMIDEIPEGLQGIVYLKQRESENKKIKLYVNTIKSIKTNNKDYIDLCSILGILIDNAIEASKAAKSKVIEINFKETGKDLNIKISNKYNNDIDINKIGNKNYSTKEYKSGLGLNFVKKINNPKIKVNFKIINNLFITDILYSIKN